MFSIPPELARLALDAAPDAMIIIDASGHVRYANRQVSALFGYAHDEIVGHSIERLMPERFRERHIAHRERYTDNAKVRPMGANLELLGRRSDGSEFPVEISLSPLKDGERELVAAAIRDVTERKRIEGELNAQLEDLSRLRDMSTRLVEAGDLPKMLEEVLDATIALQQADFGNIQLRDSASGVLTIVAQRGFSRAFLEHFGGVDFKDESACARALREGERVIIEDVEQDIAYLPHRVIAAHEGYRAVQSTPIRGKGTVLGMLSTHFRAPHRPSDRELQLTDIYMRLVAELIARARDEDTVRAAGESANRANQAKSRFLATASHDLRQPLQTLSLLNGTLRKGSIDPASAKEALAQQEQAIIGMSRLLNALLDISKLESGAIKPDPSDFTVMGLFDDLRREFAGLASNKGLKLEVMPCEDSVHSDPSLVGQILRNLISNAIKYTRAGCVGLRCLHDQPSSVRIEVLDTGIGIPAEQLRYIYDEFFQVGVPTNTTREGYGLGLSIVQRLVTLLEAKLDVHSEVGKGSSFALTLPAAAHTAAPSVLRSAPQPTSLVQSHANVLLVEDDPPVRNATRMLLKSEGYQVTAVGTVAEALQQASADPSIDLLVTDYHLGQGETGTQVIALLRDALNRPVKAILMTGDTSSAVKDLPRDPLLRIVSKPIIAEDLLSMLRDLLVS